VNQCFHTDFDWNFQEFAREKIKVVSEYKIKQIKNSLLQKLINSISKSKGKKNKNKKELNEGYNFEEKVLENFSNRWHSMPILKTWQLVEVRQISESTIFRS